jgi:hypothetical protein
MSTDSPPRLPSSATTARKMADSDNRAERRISHVGVRIAAYDDA